MQRRMTQPGGLGRVQALGWGCNGMRFGFSQGFLPGRVGGWIAETQPRTQSLGNAPRRAVLIESIKGHPGRTFPLLGGIPLRHDLHPSQERSGIKPGRVHQRPVVMVVSVRAGDAVQAMMYGTPG